MPVFKQHLHYVGHLISEQGIQPLPDRVTAIKYLKESNSIDELCHFPGLTSYYRGFVPLFTEITKPPHRLLRKDTKIQSSAQCQSAFKNLKKHFVWNPSCSTPTPQKPYTLFTDASYYAYSGVLTQTYDNPDDLRPIAYTSGSFSDIQQRWSATEKEVFAFYQSVLKFDLYLRGAKGILCCNHIPLEPFLSKGIKTPKLDLLLGNLQIII